MPIHALPSTVRDEVLWFGPAFTDAVRLEFENRGLKLMRAEAGADLDLAAVRGAVFDVCEEDAGRQGELIGASWRRLANHGLFICVGTSSDGLLVSLGAATRPLDERWSRVRSNAAPHEFAELIARHDSGPASKPNFEPIEVGDPMELSSEDKLLLSRCFPEAQAVRISEMATGLSEARVFRVDVGADTTTGSWNQPYFAKIDRLEKIETEAAKYADAAKFIPFALRPNLERVVVGAERGVLIGNLVDPQESLWNVARRGCANVAIFNLFDVTLEGWRRQAFRRAPVHGSVFSALESAGVVSLRRLEASQVTTAALDKGALPPARIWEGLSGLQQTYRLGPIHGDLHADNVLVRGSDAVLIDLALARDGPIAADPALLEVWLAFAVDPKHDREDAYKDQGSWLDCVTPLYTRGAFIDSIPPGDAETPQRWLWNAVRHIRSVAWPRGCEDEYPTAVIAALLRMAMYPPRNKAESFRRLHAYLFASDLARMMMERNQPDAA